MILLTKNIFYKWNNSKTNLYNIIPRSKEGDIMQKQRYTAQSTALLTARIIDRYEVGEVTAEDTARKLNWMLHFRKNFIYRDTKTKQYTTTLIKMLGKKRLKLFEQLIEMKGEIDERRRR